MTTPIVIDEGISSLFDDEFSEDNVKDKEHLLSKLCQDQELKERWSRYQLVKDSLEGNLSPIVDPNFSTRIMSAIESEPTVLAPNTTKSIIPDVVSSSVNKTFGSALNKVFHTSMGKRVAGFAIAASVTAVSVLSFQFNYQQQTRGQFDVAVTENSPVMSKSNIASLENRIRQPQSSALVSSTVGSSSVAQNSAAASSMTLSVKGDRKPLQTNTNRRINIANPAINAQLHKYLINHSQYVSGTKLQGVMPYARIVTGTSISTLQNNKQQ